MPATTVATVMKMLEALPESAQDRVVEHVREYIEDLRDELCWDAQFQASHTKLAVAARRARQQIAEGHSKPMDVDAL